MYYTAIPGPGACETCNGSGKNPKKRKKKCPDCGGCGREMICDNCKEPHPCTGYPHGVLDGRCSNPHVTIEEYVKREGL